MRRLSLVFLLLSAIGWAQNPAYSTKNVQPPWYTVGTLPTQSANQHILYGVYDGTTGTDCTVGGGSSLVLCAWTGSAWSSVGGSSSGGTLQPSGTPTAGQIALWVNSTTLQGVSTLPSLSLAGTGAGILSLTQGVTQTPLANSFGLQAPTSIPTGYVWAVPGADCSGALNVSADAILCTTAGVAGRAITTTDAVVTGDRLTWLTSSNAGAVALSLPQAGTAGFASNFAFGVKVTGAGNVTITPAVSTVDGNATLVVKQGQNCTLTSIDNANYISRCASGQLVAGTNITFTPSANGVSIAASGGALTINGAGAATNLSDTTPAAPANGLNVNWQISGANASAAIVGDGNAGHYLSGIGTWGSGGASPVILSFFTVATQAQNTTEFFDFGTVATTAAAMDMLVPVTGTITEMYCGAHSVASGQTDAFTAYYDDATTTTVTCTITGTALTCNVTGLSVAVTKGHKIAIQSITSATTGSIYPRCDLKITGAS